MAIHVDPSSDSSDSAARLHVCIPPEARYVGTVRDALMGFATFHGVRAPELEPLLFAVGEALANAVEHAASNRDIEVDCAVSRARIVATVTDAGTGFTGFTNGLTPLPHDLSERGRGIPIMQRFTDIFSMQSYPGRGTVVTLGLFRTS